MERTLETAVEKDSLTVVSAPGKVLLTGAYLVLERPNPGLILSTSARFYAIIAPLHHPSLENTVLTNVQIRSPQLGRVANYILNLETLNLEATGSEGGRNPFVETVVQYAVAAARLRSPGMGCVNRRGLAITILGDNNFYSHRKQIADSGLPLSSSSLTGLPAFSPATVNSPPGSTPTRHSAPEIAKTGLGSSAAMVTSVVAGLLQHCGVVSLPRSGEDRSSRASDLDLVHRLSQAAHCAAQGKVGSGFDVSAAVFGSQRYVRFSPSALLALGEKFPAVEVVRRVFEAPWNEERRDFALPPGLVLVIGEPGAGGSSTPSMVGAVQRWRKEKAAAAQPTWEELAGANSQVEQGLQRLRECSEGDRVAYDQVFESCSRRPSSKWDETASSSATAPASLHSPLGALLSARDAFRSVRRLLRRIGEEANVPIEPPSQTELLDATERLPGVLFAGVPGAGGFDAVFAVVLGQAARKNVDVEWSKRGTLTLCAMEDACGVVVEGVDPRECSQRT